MNSFAYLFERFPSFVQTFVYREAMEMVRQRMEPWLVSIRRPDDPVELEARCDAEIHYLPEEKELRAQVDRLRAEGKLPWRARRAIPRHRAERDSQRMFEAILLAPALRERGVRHIHAHFGGVAARTAWWLRSLFGFCYSFTGHANDIFCEGDFPISNAEIVRGAKFVVTETDYAREWMERKHPAARGKIFRVFNGVALDGFPPRSPASGIPRIISVGRYVEKKGFRDLIEACRLLRDRGIPFACDIIGGGPLEKALQAQMDAARLGGFVSLLGPRGQEEVRARLAQAQVFVLACVIESDGGSDNLPTVIVEAMASGLPVVSTRVGGVPEMVSDGVDGSLVSPNSPAQLADAIARILGNPALAESFAARARETAREKFAIENTTRSLKRLLVKHGVTAPEGACDLDPELRQSATRFRLAKLWEK
jgi:glycosyltransferase involved in cell wall biosynthesis